MASVNWTGRWDNLGVAQFFQKLLGGIEGILGTLSSTRLV